MTTGLSPLSPYARLGQGWSSEPNLTQAVGPAPSRKIRPPPTGFPTRPGRPSGNREDGSDAAPRRGSRSDPAYRTERGCVQHRRRDWSVHVPDRRRVDAASDRGPQSVRWQNQRVPAIRGFRDGSPQPRAGLGGCVPKSTCPNGCPNGFPDGDPLPTRGPPPPRDRVAATTGSGLDPRRRCEVGIRQGVFMCLTAWCARISLAW